MPVTTATYASAATVTISFAGLANAAYQESTAVDNNSTTNYIDCHVGGLLRVGTLTAVGTITFYAYGSYDGTEFTGGVTGVDNAMAWGTDGRLNELGYQTLPILGVVGTSATDDDEYIEFGPFSIAQAFGGVVPRKWGIVVLNSTGAAFHATQTSSECQYTGITHTTA
jgi:hypothetical protein